MGCALPRHLWRHCRVFYEWELRRTQSTFSKVEVTRFPRRSRRLFPRRNRKAAMSYNSVMGKVPPQPEMAAAFLWIIHFDPSLCLSSRRSHVGECCGPAFLFPFLQVWAGDFSCRIHHAHVFITFVRWPLEHFTNLWLALSWLAIFPSIVQAWKNDEKMMKKWWTNMKKYEKYGNIWKKCMFSFGYAQVFPRSRSCNSGIESLGDSVMGCPESAPNHRPKTKSRSLGANCSLSTCATSKKRRIVFQYFGMAYFDMAQHIIVHGYIGMKPTNMYISIPYCWFTKVAAHQNMRSHHCLNHDFS